MKRNPTKCSRRGYVRVGLRSCVAAPNLRLLDTRFTGRLPRPLPVLPGLAQSQQRGLATTKRTSPRGTKRSPYWHSPSSLLAASGRLGGAASGRYHVVIFTKRNPTKCSGRGYVSGGLRSCVAAPNLRLSTQYQIHRQIAAPSSGTSGSRAVSSARARNDETDVIARHKAIPKRHGVFQLM